MRFVLLALGRVKVSVVDGQDSCSADSRFIPFRSGIQDAFHGQLALLEVDAECFESGVF